MHTIYAVNNTFGCFFGGSTITPDNNKRPILLQKLKSQTQEFYGLKHPANCEGGLKEAGEIQTNEGLAFYLYSSDLANIDRYEFIFNSVIDEIYGLGSQSGEAMQAEVREDVTMINEDGDTIEEFKDLNFSGGEQNFDYTMGLRGYSYQGDKVSMRTPIIVLPKQKIILAYYQPAVKQLRLTKNRTKHTTTIVFKKNPDYSSVDYSPYPNHGSENGKLLIVKGNSIDSMYLLYKKLLITNGEKIKSVGLPFFFYKKPHPKAFGLGWETWGTFGGYPTQFDVMTIYNQMTNDGIKPATIIIGSGYWSTEGKENYYEKSGSLPRMEILKSSDKWPSISKFTNTLLQDDVYPIFGMRHNIYSGYKDTFLNKINTGSTESLKSKYLFSSNIYDGYGLSKNSYLINILDSDVVRNYISNLRMAYGDIKGIKEDEMYHFDEIGLRKKINLYKSDPIKYYAPFLNYYTNGKVSKDASDLYYINTNDGKNVKNISELVFHDLFYYWSNTYGGDIVLWSTKKAGQFSFPVDIASIQNAYTKSPNGFYNLKTQVDSAILRTVSGYPHFTIQDVIPYLSTYSNGRITINPITETLAREYLSLIKLKTFLPSPIFSYGYWILPDTYSSYKKSTKYFLNLASRLQQYKYSLAMRWYETGIPMVFRPLFFDYENDQNVFNMYKRYDSSLSIRNNAVDQFMVGKSMLVAPVLFDSTLTNNLIKIYLPPGTWTCFFKNCSVSGEKIKYTENPKPVFLQGGKYYFYQLDNSPNPLSDYPVFIKNGSMITILDDRTSKLIARVALSDNTFSSDMFYHYPLPQNYTGYQSQTVTKLILLARRSTSGVQLQVKSVDGTILKTYLMYQNDKKKNFWDADISDLIALPLPFSVPTPTPTPTPTPSFPSCASHTKGDADCNGTIDIVDITYWINTIRGTEQSITKADFNHDNKVDNSDFTVWLNNM